MESIVVKAVLPLIVVVGDCLAVHNSSASDVAFGGCVDSWPINVSVIPVLLGSVLLEKDLAGVGEEALGTEIRHVINLSVVVFEVPLWLIILVSMIKVESIGLKFDRKHGNWVKMHHVKALRLALVSGGRASDEVHADWLLLDKISDHLVLLLMDVRVHAPSNYMLESI